jgi:peroxiredoxin/DNA-binding transcriptional MerR regulator
MRIGELMRMTGTSLRALRYYETKGIVVPRRLVNGYRYYEPIAVRQVEQIQALTALGLSVEQTRPFVECLALGHHDADDCPSSLAAYRAAIEDMSARISELIRWRDRLANHLETAAARAMPGWATQEAPQLSENVAPTPIDQVVGRSIPPVVVAATDRSAVNLADLPDRALVFIYPLTGRPGTDMPVGWDTIPGAKGCTVEACGFRDRHRDLLKAGAGAVYGLSTQPTDYQRELAGRLGLPFPLLSDQELELAGPLALPTIEAGGQVLYGRATLLVEKGKVGHAWTSIPKPADHAAEVVAWLKETAR